MAQIPGFLCFLVVMCAFFDGSHKRRKEVSLRGASKQDDREEVLRRAAAQRLERELLRKQVAAATKVQHWFRRHRILRRFRSSLRARFDALLGQGQSSVETRAQLLNLLVAFFSPRLDSDRLLELGELLRTSQLQAKPELPDCYQLLILFCLRAMSTASSNCPKLAPLLQSLVSRSEELGPVWQPWLAKRGGCGLLTSIIAHGDVVHVSALLQALLQSRDPTVGQAIAVEVLSKLRPSPALAAFWSASVPAPVVCAFFAALDGARLFLGDLGQEAAAAVLVHVMDIGFPFIEQLPHDALLDFLRVMQTLLHNAPLELLIPRRTGGDDSDSDSDDEDRPPTVALSPMLQLLYARYRSVMDSDGILMAFVRCLRTDPWNGDVTAMVCSLLAPIMTLSLRSHTKVPFLNAICFRPRLLPAFWRNWLATAVLPTPIAWSRTTRDGVHVFAEALSHALLTLDDDDLTNKDWFVMEELGSMVKSLCQAAVALCEPAKPAPLAQLDRPVFKLLHRLHCRNDRLRFSTPDHWHAALWVEDRMFNGVRLDDLNQEGDDADSLHLGAAVLDARRPHVVNMLRAVPFVFPFHQRVRLFRGLVTAYRGQSFPFSPAVPIHRKRLYQDAFDNMRGLGSRLRTSIRVQFHSDEGPEAGIDGGGLFREFLADLLKEAFSPESGFFVATADNTIYPNPHTTRLDADQHFCFIGMVLGKAIFDGMLLDLPFATFFLLKLLSERPEFDDLRSLDPELHRNLLFLKHYPGDPEELALTFAASAQDGDGGYRQVDLVPQGRDVAVTAANRITYIFRMADYRLNTQIRAACSAFCHGLFMVIPQPWLRLFSAPELQLLISGEETHINVEDFEANCEYGGEYNASHPAIVAFWRIVRRMSDENRHNLVKFITSCPRPPLLGFGFVNPRICISSAGHEARLPTASTCINLLKLPVYPDEETLEKNLLYSITSGAGFDLS
eukprot:m.243376 g.243376  ORF g.243376 m.243376 type:complete len:956 (+) comp14229_c0_seq1:105-2972(+)